MTPPSELLQGTLDVLILKTLSWGPRHGYGVARWLEETTDETLRIEEGSLYPALYRMERKDWIEAEWGLSELGRKAKFYRLTPAGRARLRAEAAGWRRFSWAVSKVLGADHKS
jgi:PadR family transcriptional regulator, regulatory protein PadR